MTLIELLVFIAMITIGVFTGMILHGVAGFWLSIPGFIAGVLLIPVLFSVHRSYRRWVYLGDKWMPECSCGSSEYRCEKIESEYHLLCQQCKKKYEKSGDEVSVFENGQKIPYRRLVKRQGWI